MRPPRLFSTILEKIKNNRHLHVLNTLWPFLWLADGNTRKRFLGAFFIILFSTALSIAVPLFLKEVIELLNITEQKNEVLVFSIIGLYGLLWTLSRTSTTLRQVLMFRVMEKGVMQLSAKIFAHLHSLSYDFHVKRKTGEITSAIEKAQAAFPAIIWPLFFLIIPIFLEVLIISLLLSYLYGFTYGFFMMATVIIFLAFSIKALNWALISQRECNEKHYQAHSNIVDSFINFFTIKLFNTQSFEFNKCLKLLNERQESQVKALIHGRYVCLGQDFIIGIALTIFSIMCAYKVLYEGYGVSDFVLINAYLLQFSIPLSSLGFILGDFHKQLTQMEKIVELLEYKSIIKDGHKSIHMKDNKLIVSCKNIHFGYESKRPILKGVSFNLLPGKTLAFVGPTGSGKSTAINLLLRFYECTSGEIHINGEDLRTINQESLFKHVSVVPQDIALFNDTLRNNLIYGNPLATNEMLSETIKSTLLDSLVESLSNGLDTVVGERGLALSAGEKQKIGIARALLKQPSFYIFDEATSSLDVETEGKIMQNIRNKTKHATVLIIAHRLSTIKNVDEILVFNKGKIVESGTHESLLKKMGSYANMYTFQLTH